MAAAALMGLVVLGGLVGADHLLRHGVAARWEAQLGEEDEGAEWVEVTRTVEHRAQFPNERRALSRYVQGWDFEALGIPPDLFPFRATIRTRLHLPRPACTLARSSQTMQFCSVSQRRARCTGCTQGRARAAPSP